MRRLCFILLLAGCTGTGSGSNTPGPGDEHMAAALRVLRETPLVDGHNDLPWAIRELKDTPRDVTSYDLSTRTPGHTDIPRLRQGRVGIQFWSVYIPAEARDSGAARIQLEQLDIARRIVERYPDVFTWTGDPISALNVWRSGRIASPFGLEGGHAIENSLGALRAFYDLGGRYMTLTHSANIDWADSCCEPPKLGGLSEFGKEVVREMNRLGMLVDLSHVAPETMHDALDVTEAPVIFSHSSARGVTDHPRNVPDDVLRRLKDKGGVVMITFVPGFVSTEVMKAASDANPRPRATMDDVIKHIEHVRDVAGIDHVGIGGDFDGISEVVVGLEDVSTYPALFAELHRRGWSEADLRKLAGENAMEVWRRAQEVGQELRKTRKPSTATIQQLDGRK